MIHSVGARQVEDRDVNSSGASQTLLLFVTITCSQPSGSRNIHNGNLLNQGQRFMPSVRSGKGGQ